MNFVNSMALLSSTVRNTYDNFDFTNDSYSSGQFNSSPVGTFSDLYDSIVDIGGGIYHSMYIVGILCAVIAVLFVGILYAWYSHTPGKLAEVKDQHARLVILIILFIGVTWIVTMVAKLGLDF